VAARLLQQLDLGDEGVEGKDILYRALLEPTRQLYENAHGYPNDYPVEVVLEKQRESWPDESTNWLGWDVVADECRDFGTEPRILDPALVVLEAFRAAVSVATTMLLVEEIVLSTTPASGPSRSGGRRRLVGGPRRSRPGAS